MWVRSELLRLLDGMPVVRKEAGAVSLSADIEELIEKAKWDGMRKADSADCWIEAAAFRQTVESRVTRRLPLDFGDEVYAPRKHYGKKLAEAFVEIDEVRQDLRACGFTEIDAKLRDAITKLKHALRK